MRLLNVHTLILETFSIADSHLPPYAILSHTWEHDEILFSEVFASNGPSFLQPCRGAYAKVRSSCAQAARDGFKYIWIDTCCIDKASSAELSESINSMFRWYQHSAVCYVYLSDYRAERGGNEQIRLNDDDVAFCASRWFERGWTLQELIAPKHAVFFDADWVRLGTRDGVLRRRICERTSISSQILSGSRCLCPPPRDFEPRSSPMPISESALGVTFANGTSSAYHPAKNSTLQPVTGTIECPGCLQTDTLQRALSSLHASIKLSWASTRITTRPEDTAYSLLGLFDVQMPLLYGEGGGRAFLRLQAEIIKQSNDHSVLLWSQGGAAPGLTSPSCLAPSPQAFASAPNITPQRVFYRECSRASDIETSSGTELITNHAQLRSTLDGESMEIVDNVLRATLWLCPCSLTRRAAVSPSTSLNKSQQWFLGILDCGMANDYLARPAIVLEHLGRGLYRRYHHSSRSIVEVNPRHSEKALSTTLVPRSAFTSSNFHPCEFAARLDDAVRQEIRILVSPSFKEILPSEGPDGYPTTHSPITVTFNSLDSSSATPRLISSDPETCSPTALHSHIPEPWAFSPALGRPHPTLLGGIHFFDIAIPASSSSSIGTKGSTRIYVVWGLHAATQPRDPRNSDRHPWQTWCRLIEGGSQVDGIEFIDVAYDYFSETSCKIRLLLRGICAKGPADGVSNTLTDSRGVTKQFLPESFDPNKAVADRIVDIFPNSSPKVGLSARVLRVAGLGRASYEVEMTLLSPKCQGWRSANFTGGEDDQTPVLHRVASNDPTELMDLPDRQNPLHRPLTFPL